MGRWDALLVATATVVVRPEVWETGGWWGGVLGVGGSGTRCEWSHPTWERLHHEVWEPEVGGGAPGGLVGQVLGKCGVSAGGWGKRVSGASAWSKCGWVGQ
eukprot:191644-Chlamydomonas_euryale.AAC.1